MTIPKLWKRWKVTEAHLEHARGCLPLPSPEATEEYGQLLSEYQSFLEHNELELALNTLEAFGDLIPCKSSFWRNLERTAETMELHDRIAHLKQRFKQS
jgi:hypothetical protein